MTIKSKLKITNCILYVSVILFLIIAILLIVCNYKNTIELLSLYVAILGLIFGIKMYFEKEIATAKLEKLNNKNIELKQKELEILERSELIIENIIDHVVESNKELSFSLQLRNNGKTNAKIIQFNFSIFNNNKLEHDCSITDCIYNLAPDTSKIYSPRIHKNIFDEYYFKNNQIEVAVLITYQDNSGKTFKTNKSKFQYDSARNKYRLVS